METTKGKVLIIRTVKADMTSHNGYVWPRSGVAECPDWEPTSKCGNGLHGLLWGVGNWSLLSSAHDAIWIVAEVEEWIDIDGKVKFPRCNVVYCGGMAEALVRVLCSPNFPITDKTTGDYSTAAGSGEYSKAASSGDYSTAASSGDASTAASSGYYSTAASSGYYSTAASSGDSSTAASSGNYSTAASSGSDSKAASSGDYSTAASSGRNTIAMAAGLNCIVKSGEHGCLATAWFDGTRNRIAVGYVGENGIRPNTPYRVNSRGEFEEVTNA